jgi:hypothetical protein
MIVIIRGRRYFMPDMPALPNVNPNHDLDAGQATLRTRSLFTPADGGAFERDVRGL